MFLLVIRCSATLKFRVLAKGVVRQKACWELYSRRNSTQPKLRAYDCKDTAKFKSRTYYDKWLNFPCSNYKLYAMNQCWLVLCSGRVQRKLSKLLLKQSLTSLYEEGLGWDLPGVAHDYGLIDHFQETARTPQNAANANIMAFTHKELTNFDATIYQSDSSQTNDFGSQLDPVESQEALIGTVATARDNALTDVETWGCCF